VIADATYDAVILGANPAGLISAALLARRRLRVLVIDEEGKRPASSHSEAVFRRIPFLFGCGAHQSLDEVFTDIGVPLIAKKSIRPLPFAYQVILPHARIDLFADDEMLSEELAREFPRHVESLRSFYAELDRIDKGVRHLLSTGGGLPPRGLLERWRFRRMLKREHPDIAFYHDRGISDLAGDYGFDDDVEVFLRAQIAALGHQSGDAISAWEGAIMLSLFRGGGYTCYGGEEAVLGMIRNRITALHGQFLEADPRPGGEPPGRLTVRGKRVEEIVVGHADVIRPGTVISCLPPARLARWLGDSSMASRRAAGRLEGERPDRVDLAFHFTIAADAVPVGMADQAIFVADPSRALDGDNLLRFHLSPEEEARAVPEGQRDLMVTLSADTARLRDDTGYTGALLEAVKRHIASFMHFAEGRFELLEMRPGREEIAAGGGLDAFRYAPASERSLAPLASADSPLTNLAVAGRAVYPALGFLGEIVVARAVTDRILARVAT
jgi:hypothetical protein